ncbi:CDP-glycerol glycerophosphotransferase family protein [Haemophilus haemoglobinophilus]|nr:CDP-glycerol glycerophosphotransferase family protein [Canicola haemoglobinophilus]
MNKKIFTSHFIFHFYKKKFINLAMGFIRFINEFIPKDKKLIVSFIDYEKINNKLVPYKTDNVYVLSEYIKSKRDDIKIVYIPSNQFGGNSGSHISIKNKLFFIYLRFRASLFLYKQPPHLSNFFTKKQNVFCLGYFPMPFKADYWDLTKWWIFYQHIFKSNINLEKENIVKYKNKVLQHFTYSKEQFSKTNLKYVVCSDYAGEIISRSHNIPLNSFITLGSIKNDFDKIDDNFSIIDIYKVFNLERTFKKVIVYTPTFRDMLIRKSLVGASDIDKTIFGYENEREELARFLIENEILLIVKLHKSFDYYRELEQFLKKENKSFFSNCYFLDFELESKYNISIYDILKISDAMIADYSSISFDYLHYNKPIIYNTPDIEEYRKYRGFSHEPIQEMMAGRQVFTIEELKLALLDVVNERDVFKKERELLYQKINQRAGENATENIYSYLEENMF